MVPIFQMVLPRPSRASPCFHVRQNPAFPRFGAVASPDKTRSGYHPRDRPSGAVSPGIWGVREGGKSAYMLPNMPHGRRVSDAFPRQAHIRGVTSATGPARHRPARPLGASPPAGACHAAPAPDTDRPRAAASCHAGGLPYTRPAPRRRPGPPAGRHTRQRREKCAPDGVPSWVFAGRRKRPPVRGALFGLLGSTRPFTRGPRPLATPGQGWLGRRGGVGGMRL